MSKLQGQAEASSHSSSLSPSDSASQVPPQASSVFFSLESVKAIFESIPRVDVPSFEQLVSSGLPASQAAGVYCAGLARVQDYYALCSSALEMVRSAASPSVVVEPEVSPSAVSAGTSAVTGRRGRVRRRRRSRATVSPSVEVGEKLGQGEEVPRSARLVKKTSGSSLGLAYLGPDAPGFERRREVEVFLKGIGAGYCYLRVLAGSFSQHAEELGPRPTLSALMALGPDAFVEFGELAAFQVVLTSEGAHVLPFGERGHTRFLTMLLSVGAEYLVGEWGARLADYHTCMVPVGDPAGFRVGFLPEVEEAPLTVSRDQAMLVRRLCVCPGVNFFGHFLATPPSGVFHSSSFFVVVADEAVRAVAQKVYYQDSNSRVLLVGPWSERAVDHAYFLEGRGPYLLVSFGGSELYSVMQALHERGEALGAYCVGEPRFWLSRVLRVASRCRARDRSEWAPDGDVLLARSYFVGDDGLSVLGDVSFPRGASLVDKPTVMEYLRCQRVVVAGKLLWVAPMGHDRAVFCTREVLLRPGAWIAGAILPNEVPVSTVELERVDGEQVEFLSEAG